MLERKVEQRGFSAVPVLLVLVVVFAIAGSACLAYNNYHKAHQPKQISTAASSAPVTTATAQAPATTQQAAAVANLNVVKIAELGIQITVPSDIKDLTYKVSTVTLRNGKQATLAMFTTTALTHIDAACATSFGPLGSLELASGSYPTQSEDETNVLDYGQLVKQFPTFYIAAGVPNAACSTNTSTRGAAEKFKGEFVAAESTIQQLN